MILGGGGFSVESTLVCLNRVDSCGSEACRNFNKLNLSGLLMGVSSSFVGTGLLCIGSGGDDIPFSCWAVVSAGGGEGGSFSVPELGLESSSGSSRRNEWKLLSRGVKERLKRCREGIFWWRWPPSTFELGGSLLDSKMVCRLWLELV